MFWHYFETESECGIRRGDDIVFRRPFTVREADRCWRAVQWYNDVIHRARWLDSDVMFTPARALRAA